MDAAPPYVTLRAESHSSNSHRETGYTADDYTASSQIGEACSDSRERCTFRDVVTEDGLIRRADSDA